MITLREPEEWGYDPNHCAAEGCDHASDITEGTKRFSQHDIPLCTPCWIELTDDYVPPVKKKVEPAPLPEPEPEKEEPEDEETTCEQDYSPPVSYKLF